MKKIIITIIASFFVNLAAFAEIGVNMGISLSGSVFEVDGGQEKITSGNTRTENATQEAEALVGIGSIFLEKELNEKFAVGIDYVPHSLESEESENEGNGAVSNKVQVDFEDLTTIYALINFNDNVYAKAGYLEVDVITNENLGTGGAYGNTSLDGFTLGLGYERDLQSNTFLRLEASYTNLDGATLTNTADSSKQVSVDGITGYGAKLSIGKSF